MLVTWNPNSSFKYFWVVRIEKQNRSFVFWEKYGSTILFRDLLPFTYVLNMNYQGNNVLICVSLPTTVFYSCNVWPSGSRFYGQHMAVWIFRFHGCSRSLFRHESNSWCSQRVSSIRQCFASGNWECPKSSSPSPPSHFFFLVKSMLQFHVVLFR